MRTKGILIGTGVLLTCISCKNGEQATQPPNILFILADDWGYGDLGCYGNPNISTPNIDSLAGQGTRYTQFHVASGVSSPSRAAIITGQYPARHRIHGHFANNEFNAKRGMPNWLDVNIPVTMPRVMQQCGYVTAHFGKWHLGGGGEPNGDLNAPEPKEYGYDEARVWNGNGPTWKGTEHYEQTRYMDNDTLWIQNSSRLAVDETLDFMRRNQNCGKPMFINLWLKDPHTPLAPSDEQREPYKNLPEDKQVYYSVLRDADFHIGRLLRGLKEMGLEDNTIVIFSSDNGPAHYYPGLTAGSTAGLRGRKTDVFQGGVVVPFIIRWPGKIEKNRVDSVSVLSALDLLPTFCEIGGGKLDASYKGDGESFASLLAGGEFKRSEPLFWDWRFAYESDKPYRQDHWVAAAVRKDNWKLVANKTGSRIELFDIVNDPYENEDLSELHPKVVDELMTLWKTWRAELPN